VVADCTAAFPAISEKLMLNATIPSASLAAIEYTAE
jgi:hypothetical protein